jgi:hypothetical protein
MTIAKDELLFGQDSVKKDSTIIIKNTGDQDLLIQNPQLDCDQENTEPFSFSPKEIPAIIPGDQFKLTVSFNPPANKEYLCYLKLINNSTNPSMANMKIFLNGEGKNVHPISVNEGNNPDVMDIKVIPNPVTENSEIMLNIFDSSQRTLEISLIDMQGKEVKKIVNGIYSKGEYKFNLEKNNIATGKYLLVVKYGRDEQNISIIVK